MSSNGSFLYPRLERASASKLLTARAGATLLELQELGATSHPDAEPSATGGHPVPAEKLREVQSTIRAIARQAGYPNVISGYTQSFDRPCGTALYRIMEIVPADAAEEGVWSFLSVVVVPEIGPWRFPNRPDERLLGRPRNVLRRLWWRGWALGPDLDFAPEGCQPLGEDEFVQIMERPTLGGNRRSAGALQQALWRAELAGLNAPRSEMMRELARRLRATRSHILLDAVDEDELSELLDKLIAQAEEALRKKSQVKGFKGFRSSSIGPTRG